MNNSLRSSKQSSPVSRYRRPDGTSQHRCDAGLACLVFTALFCSGMSVEICTIVLASVSVRLAAEIPSGRRNLHFIPNLNQRPRNGDEFYFKQDHTM